MHVASVSITGCTCMSLQARTKSHTVVFDKIPQAFYKHSSPQGNCISVCVPESTFSLIFSRVMVLSLCLSPLPCGAVDKGNSSCRVSEYGWGIQFSKGLSPNSSLWV